MHGVVSGGTLNLFNLGGGVNYWFPPKLALRLELRDHIDPLDGPVHYWGVRFGLAF